MRAPDFWHRGDSRAATLLAPLGTLYDTAARCRGALTRPARFSRPVICVGNLTAGGAGKTPTVLALAAWCQARRCRAHLLSRGYGGREAGPLRVDPTRHGFREVGDEALLLAARAPSWIARDRRAGASAAIADGAELVIMDDGLQNPSVAKDLAFLVVDGGYGFGNGRLIPAGPLREPIERALARVAAVILVGDDEVGIGGRLAARVPVLRARLVPDASSRQLAGRRVVAFAGIGRPEKFFTTLRALGCSLANSYSFPDHHPYTPDDVMRLVEEAQAHDALPVTTEKDLVRIPAEARPMVTAVRVNLEWDREDALDGLLRPLLDGKTSVHA
ncbi:MAG TPA: tetraacyldisaccharide 4'-kinase [Alphaproteobacteria bacterium]|nr:tetraacyldisaccharide 4'-kinase [Alphaproteobacteria bacterium]